MEALKKIDMEMQSGVLQPCDTNTLPPPSPASARGAGVDDDENVSASGADGGSREKGLQKVSKASRPSTAVDRSRMQRSIKEDLLNVSAAVLGGNYIATHSMR